MHACLFFVDRKYIEELIDRWNVIYLGEGGKEGRDGRRNQSRIFIFGIVGCLFRGCGLDNFRGFSLSLLLFVATVRSPWTELYAHRGAPVNR